VSLIGSWSMIELHAAACFFRCWRLSLSCEEKTVAPRHNYARFSRASVALRPVFGR
jgi:hypothetical protein